MKSLSASIVVLSGAAIVIASIHGANYSVESSWFCGVGVIIAGLAGWTNSLVRENNFPNT